jgi:all-trans-retinol dehydrogenase (NAD+)
MAVVAGQRVLVTGGARGIGYAIAQRFAAAGCEVVLTDVDEHAVAAAAEVLRAGGARAHGYPLDVTDAGDIAAVRDRVASEVGPLDILVNNAGTVSGGPFLDVDMAAHRRTYEVNTLGVVAVTHAFLPQLLARPHAHVVIVASASALIGVPFGTTYASSKWGALGFGESLRLELAEVGYDNVAVTTVCPSLVSSGLFAGSRPPMLTRWLTPDQLADQVVRAVSRRRPILLTPWLVRLTPPLRGILPTRTFDAVSRVLGVTSSLSGWTGHGTSGPERGARRSPAENAS